MWQALAVHGDEDLRVLDLACGPVSEGNREESVEQINDGRD